MAARTLRSQLLGLRIKPSEKRTLKAAASASSRSLSQFVLESALSRADETLADRRSFALSALQWKAFLAALDAPTRPLPRMQRVLTEPGIFDSDSRAKGR